MKKRFTFLIAALMLLTMISQPMMVLGQTSTTMTFDFEDSGAHTTTTNAYTSHTYSENDVVISCTYFDCVSSSDIGGSYLARGRVAKKTTNSPILEIGPINVTGWNITSITYYTKGNTGISQVFETKTNDDASYTTQISSYTSPSSKAQKSATVSISGKTSLYLKWTGSVSTTNSSNRDFDIDDIVITYTSSSGSTHTFNYSPNNAIYGSVSAKDKDDNDVSNDASIAENAQITLTAAPNSGYALLNWSKSGTDATLTKNYTSPTVFQMGTTDASVTATFAAAHNFEFSASNGSVAVKNGDNTNITTNTAVAETATLTVTATPTSGYKFKQWNVTGSGSSVGSATTNPTTFTMGTADANLEAEFEVVYAVTYDANGATSGTVPTDDTQYTSGTSVTVKGNTGSLAKTGYDFGGWNTKADGTGTNYTAGTGTFSITANTTLYAKWDPETYTVAVAFVANATVSAAYASSTIAEGGSAPGINYGTEITLRADDLGEGKGIAWDVYKTGDATTKVTVTDNKFTVPTYNVTVSGTVGNVFVKYTGDLAEGDYVIYATDGAAMKNSLQGTNTDKFANQTTNISVSGNDMVVTDAGTEADVTWHIANISETSYWTMYNADEKKYAGSTSTKNTAALLGSVTDYAKWTYEVSDGVYDFVNYGRSIAASDQNNKYLRRNSTTGWASYATGTGTKPNLYKKTNTYQLSVEDVANITNTATPSGQSAIDEKGSAYVKPGVTVTLASTPSEEYIINEWDVYKTGTTETKVSVTSNTFTMPDYAVTVSASFRKIAKVDVNYYVNGALIETVNVTEGDELTLKTAGDISVPSGFTFAGWTDNEEDLSTLYTSTYTPVGATNLYAVFSGTKPATFSFTIDKDDFTTESYAINNSYTKNKTATATTGETMNVTCYSNQIQQNSSVMQWQKSAGYLYNDTDLGTIKSVTVTSTAGSYTTYYGTSAQPSSGTAGTGKGYFKTSVGSDTGKTSSVVVIFTKSIARKFTRIIDDDVNISTTVTLNAPAIIESGQTLTIKNGGVLNAGNYLTIDGGTLVIEDGGQLKINDNATVAATIKKSTAASSSTKTANNLYAIASPVDDIAISSFAQGTQHNVYRYDEPTSVWQEYRNNGNKFTTLTNGRGYLYRSSEAGVDFAGDVNTGNVKYDLSYENGVAKYKGLNLVGNPFTHNITWSNLDLTDVEEGGCYVLNEDPEDENHGKWQAVVSESVTVKPMQAFFVQATDESASITFKNTAGGGKGENYANDNIMFEVKNSMCSDEAYVLFKEGHGLNKIEHRNAEIPMLYVMDNGQNFAIADMSDDTRAINLGFEAKTIGQYTISLKAEGQYSHMSLYDKVTNTETDMLLEDSYTFVGTPNDRKDRFVLNLNYKAANIDTDSDIFAYQSGSDIIIRGDGELHVFDVMGRLVLTQRVNGVETISMQSQGVYIFKLNGMTQKIVVR